MASGGDNPFLPSEIIINILKRLPIKSIVQFRCVCKDWKNLIKTPSFISEHLHHSNHENPFLLLHETDYDYKPRRPSLRLLNHKMETVEVLSIPSIDCLRRGWRIIGSCNGLLCVEVNLDPSTYPHSLCLWNPVIREVREIPRTTTNDHSKFGFGFSSIINDYKILKFHNQKLCKKRKKQPHHGAEVYSLSTGSWRQLEFGALNNTTIISKPVSTDGTMFWLGVQDSYLVLISFDVATEVLTLNPTPIPCVGHVFQTMLAVYENKFAILRHFCETAYNSIDMGVGGGC